MDAEQLQSQLQQQAGQLQQQSQQLQQLSEQLTSEHQSRVQLEQQLQQQHALATVRTLKPPETDGKRPTPEHFAEAFEVYVQQKGIELSSAAACQLAATFLRDAALDWYVIYQQQVSAGTAAPFSSWQQMKQAFFRRFCPYDTHELARSRLDRLIQLRSVAEYTASFTGLMLQLPAMDEGARTHCYVRGLKPTVRVQVALHQPQSLDAAVSLAMAADTMLFSGGLATLSPFGSIGGGSSSGGFRNAAFGSRPGGSSSSHPTPMELGSLQRASQRNPQQSAAGSRVPYYSWHHRPGHSTADCRQRARSMRTQHPDGKAAKQ
jgi:hypothetical protein